MEQEVMKIHSVAFEQKKKVYKKLHTGRLSKAGIEWEKKKKNNSKQQTPS